MNPGGAAHILYVDDDANCLRGFERTLRKSRPEYELTLSDDPAEALQRFNDQDFDLLVTDIQMPGMTGIDLLRETRQSKPHIPSMILSGIADFPMALTAINELQVFRLLTKPCPLHCLVDAIDEVLDRPDRHSPSRGGKAKIVNELRLDLAFDLVTIGLIVIDADGVVHHSNLSANALIDGNDGLLVTPSGLLKSSVPADSEALMRCVARALNDELDDAVGPNVVRLSRPSMKRNLSVFAAAVPTAGSGQSGSQLAALFVLDPEQHATPSPDVVADMFGLTLSEATIAWHLMLGETIQTAADRSGVTVNTARTYLKRVFSKTDTTKQSELVSLILRSTFGMAANTSPDLRDAE